MKTIDIYKLYKEKYKDTIILIKEGIFYKSYKEDAKILWQLLEYKYINESLGFSNNSYDKVVNKLIKLNISFIIIDKNDIIINSYKENNIYDLYSKLSEESYLLEEEKNKLINKLKKVLEKNVNSYSEIEEFLINMIKKLKTYN